MDGSLIVWQALRVRFSPLVPIGAASHRPSDLMELDMRSEAYVAFVQFVRICEDLWYSTLVSIALVLFFCPCQWRS